MRDRTRLHHVALNVAKLVEMGRNAELRDDVNASDLVGIDGMGIVLALRLKGIPADRVSGVDLMRAVLELCAEEGFKPYFLGAEPAVVAKAAEEARRRYPNLQFAGVKDGYFKPEDEAAVVEDIRNSGADCLFVGMPTPRKERFLAKYRTSLNVPFIMGVGGSFDVLAGKVRRAPELMQRTGFEWLYRVYQEPRRMWWRYARTNTIFAGMMLGQLVQAFFGMLTLAGGPQNASAAPQDAAGNVRGDAQNFAPPSSDAGSGTRAAPAAGGAATVDNATQLFFTNAAPLDLASVPFRLPLRVITELLIAVELATIIIAAQIAVHAYPALGFFSPGLRDVNYLLPSIVCMLLVGRSLSDQGLLAPNAILRRQNGEWRKIFSALVQGCLFTLAMGYILQVSADYSRGWLVTWFVLSALLLPGARLLSRRVLRSLLRMRTVDRRVAVLTSGTLSPELMSSIVDEPGMVLARHYTLDNKLLGAVDAKFDEAQRSNHDPFEALARKLMREDIEEVVIVDQQFTSDQLNTVVRRLNQLSLDVFVQLPSFNHGPPILGFERMGQVSLLKVSAKPLNNWGLVAKNVFDFVASAIALTLLSPLLLLIALAIKLDSKGPVFFRQNRNGFNEGEIDVYKFRTMHVMENDGVIKQAERVDPRVTRVGWFLRRTSLDELPQLINVVKGEMSLVGPRPHAVQHNELFRQFVDRYTARHRVKPGLTGLAQINGLRGQCDTSDKMRRRVEMDIYYIENWSFWLDMRILVLTPIFGLFGKNAY